MGQGEVGDKFLLGAGKGSNHKKGRKRTVGKGRKGRRLKGKGSKGFKGIQQGAEYWKTEGECKRRSNMKFIGAKRYEAI